MLAAFEQMHYSESDIRSEKSLTIAVVPLRTKVTVRLRCCRLLRVTPERRSTDAAIQVPLNVLRAARAELSLILSSDEGKVPQHNGHAWPCIRLCRPAAPYQ